MKQLNQNEQEQIINEEVELNDSKNSTKRIQNMNNHRQNLIGDNF